MNSEEFNEIRQALEEIQNQQKLIHKKINNIDSFVVFMTRLLQAIMFFILISFISIILQTL